MAVPRYEAPLDEIARELRHGERDLQASLSEFDSRIEEVDAEIHALVDEDARQDRTAAEAAAVEARYPEPAERPPLFGVPVGVKDVVHVAGLPTRANSSLPPAELTGPEGTALSRLRDAGAVVVGKTVTTEFAYAAPGPTRNPHDADHTPGGSSSGSAAGVAAGLFPLALGTQTAGSVLRPAAYCGVVGFKPTYGRVPTDGVIPLAPSLDHLGTFTQDVAGARLAASVLCDEWDEPDAGGRPTLGVPADAYLARADDVGREAFEDHVARLDDAGYGIERTSLLDDVEEVDRSVRRLMATEAALSHHEYYERYGDRYAEETAELIDLGRRLHVADLAASRAGRGELRDAIRERAAAAGVDCWIAPAAPGPAPEGLDSTGDPAMNAPFTYAGVPAASIPVDERDGLPLGLQCVGPFGGDERLLSWAAALRGALA